MKERDSLLQKVPFLALLTPKIRKEVMPLFKEERYSFGDTIVKEGDEADAFFILTSGRARVFKKGETGEEIPLNVLRAGDEFGEIGLLEGGVRMASIRCSSEAAVLRLDKKDFQHLLDTYPEVRRHIDILVRHRSLHNFLRQFSEWGRLPFPVISALLESLEPLKVPKGQMVFRQGDEPGPMYIIKEGRLRVYKEADGKVRNLSFLRAGDFFGELSIMEGSPRAASAEALADSELLGLSAEAFQALRQKFPEFDKVIEERIAQYHADREARVPLDFSQEMLPAEASAHNKVEIDQPSAPERKEPGEPEEAEEGEEPFATPEGLFRKKEGRIRRFPFLQQIDEMDCGAASLAMICRYFGRKVSLTRIRQLAHVSYDGTSLKAMCKAASELGLAARAVKVSRRNLERMPLPAIVHWENNHWMVLFDVSAKEVRVADPAIGIRSIPLAEFQENWSGYAALFDYTEDFAKAP